MTSDRQVTPRPASARGKSDETDIDHLAHTLRRIGDRWSLLVVDALRSGPMRYGEIERLLGGIAPNVLAKRLRDLESDGIVVAAPYQDRPVRLAYDLTESGRGLCGALDQLRQWGASQRGAVHLHHGLCGGELSLRMWCPTCERVVDDPIEDELHHL